MLIDISHPLASPRQTLLFLQETMNEFSEAAQQL